jgi:hypothetical protein
MGKLALFLVAALSFAAMSLVLNASDTISKSEERVAEGEHETLARTAAVVGEDVAVQRLAETFTSTRFTGTHEGIPYEIDAAVSGNDVTVLSQATANASGDDIIYTVRAEYDRVLTSNIRDQVPPFMQYSLISEHDVHLKGTISSDVYASGYEENLLNADVHTNGDLILEGQGADRIRGHGTYVGIRDAAQEVFWDRKFDPYYFNEESGNQAVFQTAAVEIPPLHFTYEGETNTVIINSDIVVPVSAVLQVEPGVSGGTIYYSSSLLAETAPSREHPVIYYVDGNLTFSSDVEIPSYSLFLVNGNVDFQNKTITASPNDYSGGDESALGFYASGQLLTDGNAEVWAQLYSQGGATIGAGTPVLYGNLATYGNLAFNGSLDVKYREASPALTVIWNDDSVIKLRRLSYTEW